MTAVTKAALMVDKKACSAALSSSPRHGGIPATNGFHQVSIPENFLPEIWTQTLHEDTLSVETLIVDLYQILDSRKKVE